MRRVRSLSLCVSILAVLTLALAGQGAYALPVAHAATGTSGHTSAPAKPPVPPVAVHTTNPAKQQRNIIHKAPAAARSSSAVPQRSKIFMPTKGGARQMQIKEAEACGASPCDLSWWGGAVQEQPQTFVVFWGPTWTSDGTPTGTPTPDAQVVLNYFSDMGHTPFENILTQYYDSYAWIASQEAFSGINAVYYDTSTPASDTSCLGAPTIEDSAIQTEVQNALTTENWYSYGATVLVYTPSGYYVNGGSATSPNCSDAGAGSFCAYHSVTSSGTYGDQPYAAMAYPFNSGCQVPASPNGNLYGDSLANISSHEQFEAISDPYLDAWYDSLGYEIGDKCAWNFPASYTSLNNGGRFELQQEYSNVDQGCVNSLTTPELSLSTSAFNLSGGLNYDPAAQTITLTNHGSRTLSWAQEDFLNRCFHFGASSGDIPANGTQTLSLSFNCSRGYSYQFYSELVFTANTDNTPIYIPVSIVYTGYSTQWYFAEGYTGSGFTEYLTLENPNPTPATVSVNYLLKNATPITASYTVNPSSRKTVNVNSAVGADQSVSLEVTSNIGIVAERPMYFTYSGISGHNIPGGTDVLGATQLQPSWDFGYVDTTANHDTYFTILNPDPTLSMDVAIRYYEQNGVNFATTPLTIPPSSRGTVKANTDLAGVGAPADTYSAVVTLTDHASHAPLAGMVERPMYLVDTITNFTGATDVIGSYPSTYFAFAEGYTGTGFLEKYVISNPGTVAASGDLYLFKPDGSDRDIPFSLAAGAQTTVSVNSALGTGLSNSAEVYVNTGSVLAERYMSFNYSGSIQGATDVMGGTPGELSDFAEGYTGPNFSEYLTIFNPYPFATTATVTFYPSNGGTPTVTTVTINGYSRATVNANNVIPGQSVSASVESVNPLLVERPMYFAYNGTITGGTDVVGYQPPASSYYI